MSADRGVDQNACTDPSRQQYSATAYGRVSQRIVAACWYRFANTERIPALRRKPVAYLLAFGHEADAYTPEGVIRLSAFHQIPTQADQFAIKGACFFLIFYLFFLCLVFFLFLLFSPCGWKSVVRGMSFVMSPTLVAAAGAAFRVH